jgi:hypothetical protein
MTKEQRCIICRSKFIPCAKTRPEICTSCRRSARVGPGAPSYRLTPNKSATVAERPS